MIRVVLIQILLFALPFAGYAVLLAVRKQFNQQGWDDAPTARLAMIGGSLMIVGLLLFASFEGKNESGTYIPAHKVDGVLVPGHFE
ncbi:MAG: hypothetical protein JKY49_01320 [Cohaesibacteraceae bacterium]|nr:hypothetical protein [Cohaesibacteraceae bacterium]